VAGSRETLQDCRDIVVERQRRSHASKHSYTDVVMSTKDGRQQTTDQHVAGTVALDTYGNMPYVFARR
jgi:hypothetical protein